MTIAEFAEQTRKLAAEVTRIAEAHPELTAKRNHLRNVSFLTPEDEAAGYVDLCNGEVRYYPEEKE